MSINAFLIAFGVGDCKQRFHPRPENAIKFQQFQVFACNNESNMFRNRNSP